MNEAKNSYSGYRYPAEIISHTVWLDLRLTLSYRDVEDLLSARGIVPTYETVRQAVVPEVRSELRQRAAPRRASTGRQVASGLGLSQHQ